MTDADNVCPTCGRACPVDRMPHLNCPGWTKEKHG